MELDPKTQRRICDIAAEAKLAEPERRGLLLDRIPLTLAASLPIKARPRDQLLSDIIELARQRTDVGDSLVIWLENACTLCSDSLQRRPLERLMARRRRATETDVDRLTRELGEARAAGAPADDIRRLEERRVEARRQRRDGGEPKTDDMLDGADLILGKPLGEGSYARVWQAWDPTRQVPVAVRILRAGWAADASVRARFYRGARTMARFEHPGIVPIHRISDVDAEFPYLVMALMRESLKQRILSPGAKIAEGLVHIAAISEALAHLHAAEVTHRDVKPSNILIDADGRALLADFDLVRASGTTGGTRGMMGTAIYAAPELLADAAAAGPPADVYGLAMSAVFVLHGRTLPSYLMRDPRSILPRLPCGERLRQILTRCLDDKPRRRPTVDAIAAAIRSTGENDLTPSTLQVEGPPDWAYGLLLDQPRRLFLVRRARLLVYRGRQFLLSQPAFDEAVRAVSALDTGAPVELAALSALLAEVDVARAPDLGDALTGRGMDPLTAEMCKAIE